MYNFSNDYTKYKVGNDTFAIIDSNKIKTDYDGSFEIDFTKYINFMKILFEIHKYKEFNSYPLDIIMNGSMVYILYNNCIMFKGGI